MAELLRQKVLAEYLDLDPRQIRNLEKKGLPTRAVKGETRYPWPKCLHWYLDFKLQSLKGKGTAKRVLEARIRKLEAEAERAELDLLERRSELVAFTFMERELTAVLERVRAVMLSFKGKWAPELVGCDSEAEVRKRLDVAIDDGIRALQQAAAGEEDEEDGAADPAAPGPPDRDRPNDADDDVRPAA